MMHYALIVDDDANNLEVLAALLAAEGVEPMTIQDPTHVWGLLQGNKQPVDVVFSDLEMPGLNGYELLTVLRQALGAHVPVITYSVHLTEIGTAREVGFDGFLGKPLDAERFPENLRRILGGESVWELP